MSDQEMCIVEDKRVSKEDKKVDIKYILDRCAFCMDYYVDGMIDCEIPKCPLYYWMPYGALRKDRRKVRSEM